MIENLKELLGSEDQDRVKQGIELILNLGMEEELYFEFKDLLDHSDLSAVVPGSEFLDLFQEGSYQSVAQPCLLALIKVLNKSRQLTNRLILNSNPAFEELDLLNECFEGIESLELNGFEWLQTKHILELNPQIKTLKVANSSLDWSECIKVFSKVDSLSLSYLEIKAFFNEDQYNVLLPLLEKGMEGMEIHKVEELEDVLKVNRIDLGEEKDRWLAVLSHMALGVNREVQGVPFKMTYCPAGDFWMGTGDGGPDQDQDEQPRHKVKLSSGFWMGQTQVTQELWEAVMGTKPSSFEGINLPVETVSWFDCVQFCNRLSELEGFVPVYSIGEGDEPDVEWNKEATGYRLPFEHEWEYSAKAGIEWVYAGSNTLDEVGWYCENSSDETQPVAQKKPNGWGLYDLSGNVEEWCNDSWSADVYKNRTKVTIDPYVYQSEPADRSIRGGYWRNEAVRCRVALRFGLSPNDRWDIISFRLLRSVT